MCAPISFASIFLPAPHARGACRRRAGRAGVVQTLHDCRLFGAAATVERDGKVCLHGSRISPLRYRCYRGSMPATAPLVHMQNVNDRYACSRTMFIASSR